MNPTTIETPAAAAEETVLIRTTRHRAEIIRLALGEHVIPQRHWAAMPAEHAGDAPRLVREIDGARSDVQRALLAAAPTPNPGG